MRSYYYQRKKIVGNLNALKDGATLEDICSTLSIPAEECEEILEDLQLRGKVILVVDIYHLAKSTCTVRWDFRAPESIDKRVDRARRKTHKTAYVLQAVIEKLARDEGEA